ncbi:MAG TPA: class I SAM-dependent methyltransferase [Anaerolineales bacterium]|nr:class I SAM-dependent methyltransferase [Anaerolineales bacterium]
MPVNWIDVTNLSFNNLLLLERVQLSWFPGWLPEKELAIALQANPVVEWYLRHKCPEIIPWLDQAFSTHLPHTPQSSEQVRQAELTVHGAIKDLLVYAIDPSLYDAQSFLGWDSKELTEIANFHDKVVIDIGSGTGRLAIVAAQTADVVFAVEPVSNLRRYIKQKAKSQHLTNIFPVDGMITDLPFPVNFADITMGGHVFGDDPDAEYTEMMRVTKAGGMIILCPGTNMQQTKAHDYLISQGFSWSMFEEPGDGSKRKYWKTLK